jgi:hypothetical protein
LYKILETAGNLKIAGGWENVFLQSYDISGSAFSPERIADYSFEEKANGIVVMGPAAGYKSFEKTPEVFNAIDTTCTDMGIKAGCIGYNDMQNPAAYTKILADLL